MLQWVEQHTYDVDADGQFDYLVKKFDGEGKGNITISPGVTFFNNGRLDSISYDFNLDGQWDQQEIWDTQIQTYNATPVGVYGTPYYFISQTRTSFYEFRIDTDNDGILDAIRQDYNVQSLIAPVPNYKEVYKDSSGNFHHFMRENIIESNWSEPVRGILQESDDNGDGVFEYIARREDRFQNDPQFVRDNNVSKIYETYDTISINEFGGITEEKGNTLLQNLTFILIGPDDLDISSWLNDGYCANNITGEFVVIGNISVPIDPRRVVDPSLRVAENGTLAWYSSNHDGTYDIAFVFTAQSWLDKIAVAVYLSHGGRQVAYTDYEEFSKSGDQILAAHWLSSYYGLTDIMDVGWDNAANDFSRQIGSTEFWVTFLIDNLISFAIVLVSSYLQGRKKMPQE